MVKYYNYDEGFSAVALCKNQKYRKELISYLIFLNMYGKEFYGLFCSDRETAIDYLTSQDEITQKRLVNWETQDNQTILHQIAREGDLAYLHIILDLANDAVINSEKVLTPLMVSIINDNEAFSLELIKHPIVDLNKIHKTINSWYSAINYAASYCRYNILVYLIEKVRDGTIKTRNNAFDLISNLCSNVLYSKNEENTCMGCVKALLSFAHQQFGRNESFNTLLVKHVIPALVSSSYPDILEYILKEYKERDVLLFSPYNFLSKAFLSPMNNPRKVNSKIIMILLSYLLHLNQTQPFIYSKETILAYWLQYLLRGSENKLNDIESTLILSAFQLLLEDVDEDSVQNVCQTDFSTWIYENMIKRNRTRNLVTVKILCLSGVTFRLGYIREFYDDFDSINLFDALKLRLEIRDIQENMTNLAKTLFHRELQH